MHNDLQKTAAGMTLLEILLAVIMLSMFTGVVATVMEFTYRFMGEAEPGAGSPGGQVKDGVLIDHQKIHLVMDQLVDILQQPGISKERLDGTLKGFDKIAFDLTTKPGEACTGTNPTRAWRLPNSGSPLTLPEGYKLCLWKTSQTEPSLNFLLDPKNKNPKGGIYILQALPDQLKASALPVRRMFCRPRPFCRS